MNRTNVIYATIILALAVATIIISILLFQYNNINEDKPLCINNVDVTNLINLATIEPCYVNSNPTNTYYIEEYDMVVGPIPSSMQEVCMGYCIDGKCNTEEMVKYNNCMNKFSSTYCIGTIPIAIRDTQYFYPLNVTSCGCLNINNQVSSTCITQL